MKSSVLYITMVVLALSYSITSAQEKDTLYAAFWNMENLFDTSDHPDKNDKEFLPEGDNEWTIERLDKKMYNQAQVIKLMNGGKGPDIMGYCEVEHAWLMDTLAGRYLQEYNYKAAGIESEDNRGIDNGLIYKTDLFELLWIKGDTVKLKDGYPTRPIVNAGLLTKGGDTLRVFVNHWPSRRGGDESSIDREEAAAVLKEESDRILAGTGNAGIIIMGDFNDEPVNKSILEVLGAQPIKCDSLTGNLTEESVKGLYNISYEAFEKGEGTYKYKDDWNLLDQIIVSGDLILNGKYRYLCGSFSVFKTDMIVEQSGKYKGTPFPTYGGRRYLGGFSDHFPVTAKFEYQN